MYNSEISNFESAKQFVEFGLKEKEMGKRDPRMGRVTFKEKRKGYFSLDR